MNEKIIELNKENDKLRGEFNQLIKGSFGFDFEKWYQNGYWPEDYKPHLLIINDEVVASLSVYLQKMSINEKVYQFAQIGAVTTKKDLRGKGYAKLLMDEIIEKFESNVDQILLFAHDGVKGFYPKFGFVPAVQYEYSADFNQVKMQTNVRQLDLTEKEDLLLLERLAQIGNPHARLKMENGYPLVMFYLTYFMSKSVYYLAEFDAIVVFDIEGEAVYISEILGGNQADLLAIVNFVVGDKKTVTFGFAPVEIEGLSRNVVAEEDTNFYILKADCDLTGEYFARIPVLAQT